MKKDLSSKEITKCKDVFSDICNVNLFSYRKNCPLIRPEELEQMPTDIVYRDGQGKLKEHRMDVRMKHTISNTSIALLCLENQAGISNIMPVRSMGYIYSNYHEQIQKMKEENERHGISYYTKEIGDNQKLVPVICLVLYYGTEEWMGARTINEMLDIPEEWQEALEPWIDNHKVHIISLTEQSEETREKYQSDFRHIVDYLVYVKQKDKNRLEEFFSDSSRKIVHPQEFLDMMYSFTRDKRYQKMAEQIVKTKPEGDEITMCMLLDMAEEKGSKQGIDKVNLLNIRLAEEGRTEDILEAAKDMKLQQQLMERYGI